MRITLAERVRVESGDACLEERALPGRQGRLLFAYLAMEQPRPVPRSELAELLWPQGPPPTWEKAIAVLITRLRAGLGEIGLDGSRLLVSAFGCYQLLPPDGTSVDVEAAHREVGEAEASQRRGEHAGAAEQARAAAEVLRRPFLPGEEGEWVERIRSHLKDTLLRALDCLADVSVAAGDPSTAVEAAEEAVALEPYREPGYQRLMRALAAAGDRTRALQVYARCRELLTQELGVDPAPQTEAAYLEVLRATGTRAFPTADQAATRTPNNLPPQTTSFIGREQELTDLSALLERERLVTLTGAGGSGKTRLALQAATFALDRFPDGIFVCDLAPLLDPGLVERTIARALGVREAPPRPILESLAEWVGARELVVLLDNCEHVVKVVAAAAEAILEGCPRVRVLATSRRPLGIAFEHRYSVPTLAVPDPAAKPQPHTLARVESVRLFLERALSARPSFVTAGSDLEAVGRICRRLDGIPFAIELAAARVRVLGIEEIEARLADRFALLTRPRTPARHVTLRAALDWSHDLLSETERILFRRLAVFAGGCDLHAAEHVCGGDGIEAAGILDLLSDLVDHSLLTVEHREGRVRYRLLETLRQYGAERLAACGEETSLRKRHLAWCLVLAEPIGAALRQPDQHATAARLDPDHDNFRSALGWAIGGADPDAGLALATRLGRFWEFQGYWVEGRAWVERSLAAAPMASEHTKADALTGSSVLAWRLSDYAPARARAEEALAIQRRLGNQDKISETLNIVGFISTYMGDYEFARESLDGALAGSQRTSVRRAGVLGNLGELELAVGHPAASAERFRESIAVAEDVGEIGLVIWATVNLGRAELLGEDMVAAREHLEESLARSLRIGGQHHIVEIWLGRLELAESRWVQAAERFRESLRLHAELGDKAGTAACLEGLAHVSASSGDAGQAARLLGAAETIRAIIAAPVPPTDRPYRERAESLARAGLTPEDYAESFGVGSVMSVEDAIAFRVVE